VPGTTPVATPPLSTTPGPGSIPTPGQPTTPGEEPPDGDARPDIFEGVLSLSDVVDGFSAEAFATNLIIASLLLLLVLLDSSIFNSTIEENLGLGAIRCNQLGVMHTPTEAYLNPINFFQVARRQGAKVMYTNDVTRAKIGFQYIDIVTATGTMRVYSDPDCPTTLGYGENPQWDYVHYLGPALPHVVMNGKEPMLLMNDQLAYQSSGATVLLSGLLRSWHSSFWDFSRA
jgi:hypothetical protein